MAGRERQDPAEPGPGPAQTPAPPRSEAAPEGRGSPTSVAVAVAPAIPAAFQVALRRVLRPLARLLLDFHVPFPYASSLLKAVYVDVAAGERTLQGRPQTDSRVSLLTGVHRKDVKRLREERVDDRAVPESVSLSAQVVQRWTSDRRYLDESGRPLPLPRSARGQAGPTFEQLVESVSKDIRARAVLDEWLHLGVAWIDPADRVCLRVDGFVPQHGLEQKSFYFGRNVSDHIEAAAHNLRGWQPPLFERSVSYDGLLPESLVELERLASEVSMDALRRVNQRAAELQRRDADREGSRVRFTLGTYFLRAPLDSGSEDE